MDMKVFITVTCKRLIDTQRITDLILALQHNGEWDAFRHAYASGAMTREYGETAAHLLEI